MYIFQFNTSTREMISFSKAYSVCGYVSFLHFEVKKQSGANCTFTLSIRCFLLLLLSQLWNYKQSGASCVFGYHRNKQDMQSWLHGYFWRQIFIYHRIYITEGRLHKSECPLGVYIKLTCKISDKWFGLGLQSGHLLGVFNSIPVIDDGVIYLGVVGLQDWHLLGNCCGADCLAMFPHLCGDVLNAGSQRQWSVWVTIWMQVAQGGSHRCW